MHAIFLLFNLSRRSQWLLGGMLVLHGVLGASLGLSVDEAHYVLYAARLDWSYFDHPPLVGWLQAPWVALQAPVWVLRLLPELIWLGTALLAHTVADQLAPRTLPSGSAGFWAIVVLALAPLCHILGIGLLPDTLLMFFTLLVMVITFALMHQPLSLGQKGPWIALGILLGLAGLSKYTAIFTALAVALCLFYAHGWRLLRQSGLWLALALALLLVTPVLYWNAQHDWVSFRYQVAHGAGGGWEIPNLLRFLLIQCVVYGVLFFWGFKGLSILSKGEWMLSAFFAIPFGILTYLSGGGSSLPHWTAPAWTALIPFAGIGLARSIQQGYTRLIATFATLQVGFTLTLITLLFTGGQPLMTNTYGEGNATAPSNPFADVYGWDKAGKRARILAAQHYLPRIAVQNWTLASRMDWYARPLPVHVLAEGVNQFSLWSGSLPVGSNVLLVQWSQLAQADAGDAGDAGDAIPFSDCELLDTETITRFDKPISEFYFYACYDYSP